MRNLCLLIVSVLLFTACNHAPKGSGEAKIDTATMSVMTFDSMAPRFVDKPVWIEGTVLHTCREGGKRLFLADGTDSITVEVTTGEKIAKFDESLTGSRIRVLGILKELRIDEKYLNEWEAEIKKQAENHETGIHTAKKGHEDQSVEDKMTQVNQYREEIKKSGTDHLSFYSVKAISYKEIK